MTGKERKDRNYNIETLYSQGATYREIAKLVNLSESGVYKVIHSFLDIHRPIKTNLSMISKELFIKVIRSIQLQLAEDKKNAEIVAEIFGSAEFNLYNNERLINSLVEVLEIWFDKSELHHYMFVLNFGKLANDEDFESIEELYDRLVK